MFPVPCVTGGGFEAEDDEMERADVLERVGVGEKLCNEPLAGCEAIGHDSPAERCAMYRGIDAVMIEQGMDSAIGGDGEPCAATFGIGRGEEGKLFFVV